MTLPLPGVMALAPASMFDPRLVIAAARAGALGLFDAEPGFDHAAVLEALERTAELVPKPFGIRIRPEAIGDWLARAPRQAEVIVCTEPGDGSWRPARERIAALGRRLVAEVTSRSAARAAREAGVEAMILAGHEAGGRGGAESSFVLLQGVLADSPGPVWVRGGVGLRVAAACRAAGAAGVVLEGALLLARESPLPAAVKERIAHWDGSETVVLGAAQDEPFRLHAAPGSAVLNRLRAAEAESKMAWRGALAEFVQWTPGQAWPVGQDAALAAPLARRYVTVGGIVQAVNRAMEKGPLEAARIDPLGEGSLLAQAHGTRYPIVQGPMTRVSDTVAFASAVAEGGALPFLALALMRGAEVRKLLADAAVPLAGKSWGVGILGFVPADLRREQVAAIREARPPFALIAGGRPDQARELEREGISTYLHVPSPGLLRQFLKDGARRFVLEGRECGGHVGPRSSFVLWEQAVETVLQTVDQGANPAEIHLLFAGGIHDARSAAIVATLAAPLAERGVRIGVLVGTAYLFTEEAVTTGAIVQGFQAEAVQCRTTVLLETGPGHEVRVCPTPFADSFGRERIRLLAENRPADEVRTTLEDLNVGRLRIAAKGVDRRNGAGSALVPVAPDAQREQGLYMVGQVATLRERVVTIADLHRDISPGSTEWLRRQSESIIEPVAEPKASPSDVAIIGMASIFPGAADVRRFWENTLRGFDAITEVPADRWDWRLYYDPDPKAPDKITSKWGGFIPEIPFDPLRYGMPPTSLSSIEPMHLLTLEVVRAALADAGYADREFVRERTSVILGAGGGAAQLAMGYAFRSYLPLLDTVIPEGGREALAEAGQRLPEWTEDSFPGILLNVAAGRVANRFDLGGANYTVDAACGSSLAAASLAVRELETGAADMVILGGADTVQNPFTYLAFSKTHAFSSHGRCRPFDVSADGIVISEGVAVLVLKRLADAERDGDRIYAVFKGLGASSDGRAKGLTAPSEGGQVRALRRAYEKAGISPDSIGYVEAHGTGTAAGDLAEVKALSEVFGQAGTERNACALGSVKSSIGHTKCAAGLAGLINAALALYHEVLPPTIGVKTPNPRAKISESPFHISTATRPWLAAGSEHPRRAGVSAFGFGGTNFHAVLEAYEGDPSPPPPASREWPAELLVWQASDRESLLADLDRLDAALASGAHPELRDLAHTLNAAADGLKSSQGPRLAIVASSLDDLAKKLRKARQAIAGGQTVLDDPQGIFFAERPLYAGAKVAFVFPGQGSQYPNMLCDLAVAFPEVRRAFDAFDDTLRRAGRKPVGPLVFPPPPFSDADKDAQRAALRSTEIAQPAVGAACVGMLAILDSLGLQADMAAGHSYGELLALHAGGVFSVGALAELSEARGRLLLEAVGDQPGEMAAIAAGPSQVQSLLEGIDGLVAANWNGPSQTVVSGTSQAVRLAVERASSLGLRAQRVPVACAFHSPLVAAASDPLAKLLGQLEPGTSRLAVYGNTTASRYPSAPEAIPQILASHLVQPVRFAEMIERMYSDGARVFVEVGPSGVTSALIGSILAGQPHLAVACDQAARPGIPALLFAIARLTVGGVSLSLDRLTAGRGANRLDPVRFTRTEQTASLSSSNWFVNGARVRPAHGTAAHTFGPGPRLPAAPRAERQERAQQPSAQQPSAARKKPPIDGQPDAVVEAFQRTMQKFLDVQQSTMLAYLAGGSPAATRPVASPVPASPPASQQAPPANDSFDAQPAERNGHDTAENGQAAPPQSDRSAPGRVDRQGVADRLLEIVQERTGYPAEMLRLDLDLEADLGIDSIKRVEILGSLRDALPDAVLGSDSETMDLLSRARTLGAIVDRVGKRLESGSGPVRPSNGNGHEHGNGNGNGNGNGSGNGHRKLGQPLGAPVGQPVVRQDEAAGSSRIERLVLQIADAALPAERAPLVTGGVIVITDDGRGIARAVAADLRAFGYQVVRVRHGLGSGEVEGANFASPSAIEALLDRIRTRGPICGILHAMPLATHAEAELDSERWSARLKTEVRGLFLLAKAAADDLARASGRGGSCLIAATGMGGAFASGAQRPADFFAGQGAIAGLIKTLAREWPSVRTRVVDLQPADEVEVLAAHLVHEVLSDDLNSEVGYSRGRRVRLQHVETPLATSRASNHAIELAPGEPILVTGGARGITASVLGDLAARWRPTLLLIGTSPRPSLRESDETRGIESAAELKAHLLGQLRREGRSVGPADVERAHRALRREREIRANLAAFEASGARVEYAQADVRDAEVLARLVAGWEARFGPPVGLIHGAGVIQDKLICDKTPESFDHVLGTKLDGALNLARLLKPESLRFAAFFSSVAGRFGNRGQGDYAAASEALNKLAIWLDERWACRVVSFLWGPWSGIGMVSDLEAHLGRRGLGMIPPEIGRTKLADELRLGPKGQVEVIIAGDLGNMAEPQRRLAVGAVS